MFLPKLECLLMCECDLLPFLLSASVSTFTKQQSLISLSTSCFSRHLNVQSVCLPPSSTAVDSIITTTSHNKVGNKQIYQQTKNKKNKNPWVCTEYVGTYFPCHNSPNIAVCHFVTWNLFYIGNYESLSTANMQILFHLI